MPGIAGTAGKTDSSQLNQIQTLDLMLGAMTQDWYVSERYSSEHDVAIGLTCPPDSLQGSGPQTSQDGSLSICIYGEIYTVSADKGAAQGVPARALIAATYNQDQTGFASKLHGEYFTAIHDVTRNKIVLATDRFGRRPVYYTQIDGQFVFSSEIKSILVHPAYRAILDLEGLADLLSFGYILGERTLLKNIELMPPASVLEYDLAGKTLEITPYWDISEQPDVCTDDDGIILDRISSTFRQAVECRLSGDRTNWISLSGGMDSRVIAAVVDPEASPVQTVTSGIAGSYEKTVTEAISREIGCQHLFYTFDENEMTHAGDQLMSLYQEAVALTDGMRGTVAGAMTAFSARKRRQHGLDIVLTGHGGEVAKLDQAYGLAIRNEEDIERIQTDRLQWAFDRMTRTNAPELNNAQLYSGELADVFDHAPRAHLERETSRLATSIQPAQFVSYLFINELFRKRALYALMMHRAYTCIRLPFYDDHFLDAIINAPLHLRYRNRIHGHIIRRFKPELLNIVLTDSRARPFAGKMERLMRQIPFKIGRKLGFYKRDFPEDFFAAHTQREFFRNILLDPLTLDRGLFNPDVIINTLSGDEAISENVYSLLHHLSIVEIWHRTFID